METLDHETRTPSVASAASNAPQRSGDELHRRTPPPQSDASVTSTGIRPSKFPPQVPDLLREVMRPKPVRKPSAVFTAGTPAPLSASTSPSELLKTSKTFSEIMSYHHSFGGGAEAEPRIATGPSPTTVGEWPKPPPSLLNLTQASHLATGGSPSHSPPNAANPAAAGLPPHAGEAMFLYSKNCEYVERIKLLEKELAAEKESNLVLQEQLELCCSQYVPPKEFLPTGFYEHHHRVIDALNDYYVLHRVATAQRALRRDALAGDEDLELYGSPRNEVKLGALSTAGKTDLDAKTQEEAITYLRSRVADLTMKLKQHLHQTKVRGGVTSPSLLGMSGRK